MVLRSLTRPSRTNTKKDVLFSIGDWNTKIQSQELPGVIGKFGLGVQNEEGQRTKSSSKRMHWSFSALHQSEQTPSSNNTRKDPTHGQHQMVNTEIRLIIFFEAKDGEALYSQRKQDWELTVLRS